MSCRSGVIRSSGTQIGGEDAWASLRVCESESVSHVQLFATPWTPAMGLYLARLLSLQNSLGKNTGVGSHSCLQGIFPVQRLNPGLLHCRQILYPLKHQDQKEESLNVNSSTLIAMFPQINYLISLNFLP